MLRTLKLQTVMKLAYNLYHCVRYILSHKWKPAMLASLMALTLPLTAGAQVTFIVNSNGDNANENPGNGNCSTGEEVGTVTIGGRPIPIMECTLRAAIEEANESSDNVIISFNSSWLDIHADGYSQIFVRNALPYIANRVTIAGETHPEFEEDDDHPLGGRPTLFINGGDISASGLRFRSESSGSVVRHISIGGFGTSAILLQGNLGSGSGNNYTIENNLIGGRSGPASITMIGNGRHGIDVASASEPGGGITNIRSNIIFNNEGDGIHLRSGTSATFIQNNIIGLRPFLTSPDQGFRATHGNLGAGVYIAETAGPDNHVGAFSGNTISNNGSGGIHVRADGQTIFGNHIGLPHDGIVHTNDELSDYGNDSNGIILESSGNTVGGSGAATNIIGNSQFVGIRIGSGGSEIAANDNVISRNYIGTDPDGQDLGQSQGIRIDRGNGNRITGVIIANNTTGIELRSDAGSNNEIVRSRITDNSRGIWFRGAGGVVGNPEDLADANIIGENINGVDITGDAGQVGIVNNYIGTDETGANLGNSRGIRVAGDGSTVFIGVTGGGNIIGNNTRGIVLDDGASQTSILSNHIGIHPNGEAIGNVDGIYAEPDAQVGPSQIGYNLALINADRWDPGTDPGNIIAYNRRSGINLSGATAGTSGNAIRGNSIYGNGSPTFANEINGINLGMESVDVGGGSNGPNTLLNFPEFDTEETFYNEETGQIELRYRVRTNATNANYNFGIDIFLAREGERQGKTFLGTVVYEEDNATSWVFDAVSVPQDVSIAPGDHIVATTTDGDWNTSQFSEPVIILEKESEIWVSGESLDFGSLTEGESGTLSFQIESRGDADLIGDVSLADDDGGAFAIISGEGDFELESGASLEVEITFTPGAAGDFSGLIAISHDAVNESAPVEVTLQGTGTAAPMPAIVVSANEVEFDEVAAGESDTHSFTVTNNGDAELSGEVSLADDAGGAFAITSGSGSFNLGPADDFEVTISFNPDNAGGFTGQLEIVHNADNNDSPFEVALMGTGAEPTDSDLLSDVPTEFSLWQNYPNPFNPSTQIRFDLPESAHVRLDVYNSLGQRVATLVNETKSAGSHEIGFDAGSLSSGHYLYRLEAGSEVFTRTMTLIK